MTGKPGSNTGKTSVVAINQSTIKSNVVDPVPVFFDSTSTAENQFGDFGTPLGSTPGTFIYDSTQTTIYGDLYPTWDSALAAAIYYGGLAHIYIQNGSIIPAGTYTMPPTWDLTIDGYGTTFGPGLFFDNNPVSINVLHYGTITCNATDGTSTFILNNPTMTISGADLILGTNGNLIDDTTGEGLLVLDNTVVSTSGQTLLI